MTTDTWKVEWDSAREGGWTVFAKDGDEIVRDSNHETRSDADRRARELNDTPTVAEAIGSDIDQRAELLELADLAARFLAPAVVQATRRVERMTARPAGTHAQHKIDDARQELQEAERALELARKHSPTRNAILEKFGTAAG